MYDFIEHLFLETGFPVHACLLGVILIIVYWLITGDEYDD